MTLPDPQNYSNGVRFFHDSHKVVLQACALLDELLSDAEKQGVFQSFGLRPEWKEVFDFFEKSAPRHERDEDEFLFPVVASRVPHMGFQQPDSTIRFLMEGHEVMMRKIEPLVRDWQQFLSRSPDAPALASAHAAHAVEDAQFIANGKELIKLYREHVEIEETRVYAVAEKVLSGEEKLAMIDRIREAYDNEEITGFFTFDTPQFTDPRYNAIISTDAISEKGVDAEDESEDEEEEGYLL